MFHKYISNNPNKTKNYQIFRELCDLYDAAFKELWVSTKQIRALLMIWTRKKRWNNVAFSITNIDIKPTIGAIQLNTKSMAFIHYSLTDLHCVLFFSVLFIHFSISEQLRETVQKLTQRYGDKFI